MQSSQGHGGSVWRAASSLLLRSKAVAETHSTGDSAWLQKYIKRDLVLMSRNVQYLWDSSHTYKQVLGGEGSSDEVEVPR